MNEVGVSFTFLGEILFGLKLSYILKAFIEKSPSYASKLNVFLKLSPRFNLGSFINVYGEKFSTSSFISPDSYEIILMYSNE